MARIGRNDPCPCGSGKKAKQCCLLREGKQPVSPADDVAAEVGELLGGQPAQSMEHLQSLVNEVMARRNRMARDDFHGLTPEQMHRMLNFPFTSPNLFAFPDPVEGPLEAPILSLFGLIAEGVGEQGLKATAKGNLPRALCREAALRYLGAEAYEEKLRWGAIHKEEDYGELHVTRIVAQQAGLLHKQRGRFALTRECRRRLAAAGPEGVYPLLFRAYVQKYNWLYLTRFPDVPFLQQSFLFTLYLLTRLGGDWKLTSEYEDAFLRAFPQVLDEFTGNEYFSPESRFRSAYRSMALLRFTDLLGLAEVEPVDAEGRFARQFRLRSRPSLAQVVKFLF